MSWCSLIWMCRSLLCIKFWAFYPFLFPVSPVPSSPYLLLFSFHGRWCVERSHILLGSSYFFFLLCHCLINLSQSVYRFINSFFYQLISAMGLLSGGIRLGYNCFQLQIFSLFLWKIICPFTDIMYWAGFSHLHLFCEQITLQALNIKAAT